MRKLVALSVLTFACVSLLWMPKARTAANDEAQIRQLIDRWAKAFRAKDLNAIMSIYQPGQALVAFDLVPPLQYLGSDAYKKDYQDFLAQYQGAIDVEIRDLSITTGDGVAFSHSLERISGTMANGQKSDLWVRAIDCYRKINGHWLVTHEHISVPVDLDSGKAVLNLKP